MSFFQSHDWVTRNFMLRNYSLEDYFFVISKKRRNPACTFQSRDFKALNAPNTWERR